jgi:hypothetical protein
MQAGGDSLDPDALAEETLVVWSKVRKPGDDALTIAAQRAKAKPLSLSLSGPLTLLVSLAFYLQSLHPGQPIYLPRRRVAALLGLEHQQVSRLVRTMETLDLLRLVDGDSSFTKGKAKTYFFNALALFGHFRVDGLQISEGSNGPQHTPSTSAPEGSS